MLKKRNLIFLFLLILGILLITGCLPNHLPTDIDRYVSKTGYNENDGSLSNPWATISHALSNTPDGGTIHVADGTYEENISFPFDKAIILKSENGASSTTIKGDDSSRVVEIVSCPDGTTLDGFTITGGNGNYGGGIYIEDSSATIQNNTISENTTVNGGGIYTYDSSLTIQNNTISGNTADYGGGITIAYSSATIQNNTISGNTASSYGCGIYIHYSSPTILNNTITENTATHVFALGGGISIIGSSSPTIQNNTISGNTAGASSYGGGIFIGVASSPTIGGANGDDTANFNTVCGNSPNQIHPDSYPNNYIFQFCF